MEFLRKLLGKFSVKRFDSKLDVALKEANKLYKEKGNTVVCEYCGQLMPKNEAEVVYNLETKKMEYSHTKCFQENNAVHKGMPEEINNEQSR